MCSLFDSLARRAEVMLPGETVSLTQDTLLSMLTACAPCRASKRALGAIAKISALPLTEPPLATGRYSVAAVAERVGVSTNTLRTLIANNTFGPSERFRADGRRKYLIPGAIAERLIEHVHFGAPLRTFRVTEDEMTRAPDHVVVDDDPPMTAPVDAVSPAVVTLRPVTTVRQIARPARRAPMRSADARMPRNTTASASGPRDVSVPTPLDSWRSIANPRSTPR